MLNQYYIYSNCVSERSSKNMWVCEAEILKMFKNIQPQPKN